MPLLRPRRVRAGLVIATLLLGGGLAACGGETTGDTTCGEFTAMSDQEKRDLIKEGVSETNDDDTQSALDAASDEDLDQVAELVIAACSGKDDDTSLDDASS